MTTRKTNGSKDIVSKDIASKERGGVNRRDFVKTTVAGAAVAATASAAGTFPTKVFAQSQRDVAFTLSWIPNGGSAWVNVGLAKGIFKKHGFNVSVSRGFGSVASAQAVAQGKFNFGVSAAPTSYLQCVKGMKIMHLGCTSYSSAMGVGFLRNNGIKTPKDLEGKKMGSVVASGEFPFLPAFAKRAGFDWSKVEVVQVDNKIRTGVMLSKQVDCISCFATSVAPDVATKGYDVGWFLYDDYGMGFYGYMLITQPEMLKKDKALCEAFTEAHMEAVKYTMLNPDEALAIFLKQVPEAGMTPARKKALAMELGLFAKLNLTPEVKNTGIGSISMKNYESMAEMIMKYVAKPGEKAPALDAMLHTGFIDNKVKFSSSELTQVEAYAKQFDKVLA